jgi:hypothetical protein
MQKASDLRCGARMVGLGPETLTGLAFSVLWSRLYVKKGVSRWKTPQSPRAGRRRIGTTIGPALPRLKDGKEQRDQGSRENPLLAAMWPWWIPWYSFTNGVLAIRIVAVDLHTPRLAYTTKIDDRSVRVRVIL